MAEPKQYVPRANCRSWQTQFGEVLSLGFDVKELIAFAEKHKNDRGFLNLTISPRKEPDERATHSVYLDTYQPGQRGGQASSRPARQSAPAPQSHYDTPPDDGNSGVPF